MLKGFEKVGSEFRPDKECPLCHGKGLYPDPDPKVRYALSDRFMLMQPCSCWRVRAGFVTFDELVAEAKNTQDKT